MRVNIREVIDRREIIKAFSHLYTDRSKVLLWQTSKKDAKKKTLIYCELVSIDNKNIYLTPFNAKLKDVLNKTIKTNNKIFIRGTYNGVLFKSDDFIIRGEILEIPLPAKILLSENRRSERFSIKSTEYAYVKLLNKCILKNHQRTSHKVQDFSEDGFSIQMTKHESHHYEINKEYPLLSIAGNNLPKGFTAQLVYQKVHTYIKNTQSQVVFKAGFRTNKKIPKRILQRLMSMAKNKVKAA